MRCSYYLIHAVIFMVMSSLRKVQIVKHCVKSEVWQAGSEGICRAKEKVFSRARP
jgi:hypothetical protein